VAKRQRELKGLSKRSRTLLQQPESYDVDYKESMSGLSNEDLVAFANSDTGGAILVGVREITDSKGQQRGKIIGCTTGDREKLKVINKGESCIPPIQLEVYTENLDKKPIFRIEIPTSQNKPHCTSGGTYKIRGDGRNKALSPPRLLHMFMESQYQTFIERFKVATSALDSSLANLLETSSRLEHVMTETFKVSEETQELADEAMTFSDQSLSILKEVRRKTNRIERGQKKLQQLIESEEE